MRNVKIEDRMMTEFLWETVRNSPHYDIVMNAVNRVVDRVVYGIYLTVALKVIHEDG